MAGSSPLNFLLAYSCAAEDCRPSPVMAFMPAQCVARRWLCRFNIPSLLECARRHGSHVSYYNILHKPTAIFCIGYLPVKGILPLQVRGIL